MNYYNQIKQEFIDNEIYIKVKDYSKNKKKLETYYNVGKLLIEAQRGEERAKYGNKLIKEYSEKLTNELGKGYSVTNLKYMREFYLLIKKGQPMADQLAWSHYQELLPIKNNNKRNYYITECIKNSLSRNELRKKIKSNEYERLPNATKNKLISKKENNIEDFIKNPIVLPNIMYKEVSEKILKQIILENMELFLKELGDGFSFIDSEYKIKLGDRYNYIDLLLFNYIYNSFVVVELKVTELKAEHIGQIKKYINYIDKNIKTLNQNNTIGIIICRKDNKFIMEYCSDPRIFKTTYTFI